MCFHCHLVMAVLPLLWCYVFWCYNPNNNNIHMRQLMYTDIMIMYSLAVIVEVNACMHACMQKKKKKGGYWQFLWFKCALPAFILPSGLLILDLMHWLCSLPRPPANFCLLTQSIRYFGFFVALLQDLENMRVTNSKCGVVLVLWFNTGFQGQSSSEDFL